ncbi:MAG TPA: ABC transporter permease [Candidatus Bathyarchaeia archaeon]|nr:ABC transporter permease [Candidatus Bathyarchaeia archaeon]
MSHVLSTASRVPYRIIRLKKFFQSLLSTRMAAAGLVLLLFFLVLAVAAPLLTPYHPKQEVVSASLDPPSWITFYTGAGGYSQNTQFSQLTYNTVGSGITLTKNSQTSNSLDFAVNSTLGGKIQLVKTLNYPYQGESKDFLGNSIVIVKDRSSPFNATDYVTKLYRMPTEENFTFWTQTLTNAQTYSPVGSLDANNVAQTLRLGGTSLNAAEVIFNVPGTYRYVLELTLPNGNFHADVSVKEFQLAVFGNTFGWMGTDDSGYDVFTQFVYGARLSLIVGLTATVIGIGLGLLVGLMAGYLGKLVDEVLMRFTDMMLVIPSLPLLIVLVAVLGQSLTNIIFVLGFLGWMGFARLVRSQVLSLRERPFIEAAKASGAGTGYIVIRHIFTNIVSLTYVNLALSVPSAIVGEAALSFLGLGSLTETTWGRMLAEARGGVSLPWWWIIPPGLGIAVLSLSFILLGFGFDAIFNPRLRRRR